jgi:AMP deaminase
MEFSSSASPIHLALATLFGASVMAISAFYIHKRSVDQVLDRFIKLRCKSLPDDPSVISESAGDEESYGGAISAADGEIETDGNIWRHGEVSRSLDQNTINYYRASSSMLNVGLSHEWMDEDGNPRKTMRIENQALSASLDKLDLIASGLPPLRTDQRQGDGQFERTGSKMRIGSVGRLVTPRSSAGYAYESVEDSDEERTELATEEDSFYTYEDQNYPAELVNNVQDTNTKYVTPSAAPPKPEISNSIQLQKHRTTDGETKTSAANGDGKMDAASVQVGIDQIFANSILRLPSTVQESVNVDEEERKMIRECLDLREKYIFRENVAPWVKSHVEESNSSDVKVDPFHFAPIEKTFHQFRMEDGVGRIYATENDTEDLFPVASSTTFFTDMHHLLRIISIGNVRSMCHHRLRFLEEKFRLHLLVHADREFLAQKGASHRDFYNIRKVDTHVHHSACMNQKHLLRFIKLKLRTEPDEVVIFRDGQYLTLKEVFESLDLNGHDLNVDLLDVHADKSTFHRFDKFNLKYNPCGQSRLREIFLKQDNLIQGRFIGEVTKQVLADLEASKYQMAEYRISIYGRKQSEWDQLASWFINNGIHSENAVWLIQLPRLYNVYKSMGTVTSFQNILDNLFIPLFEVSIDPNSHPQLHVFLMQVVGFDIVDDESKPERRPTKHMPKPSEWTNEFNPAFSYYAYYCYANFYTLNKLRESKGMPTIRFRPHCGEAGDIDHLAAGFLLCHNISHGINLRKSPVLQYLYYLSQIGLAMSPLSNNSLFLDYHRNPFPMFFQRGLNVSLSSDDPLQIHLTKEPLVEEYSVAAKVWKLSSCDLCEIARNSVYQSGFSHAAKVHWLGNKYFKRGPEGNDIHKTNVPNLRISFRQETWKEEMQYVFSGRARLPEDMDH